MEPPQLKTYLCTYVHQSNQWALQLKARDRRDASARVAVLGTLLLQGEIEEIDPFDTAVDVLPIGTTVAICSDGPTATITAVILRGGPTAGEPAVYYEVAWAHGGILHAATVHSDQVGPMPAIELARIRPRKLTARTA